MAVAFIVAIQYLCQELIGNVFTNKFGFTNKKSPKSIFDRNFALAREIIHVHKLLAFFNIF